MRRAETRLSGASQGRERIFAMSEAIMQIATPDRVLSLAFCIEATEGRMKSSLKKEGIMRKMLIAFCVLIFSGIFLHCATYGHQKSHEKIEKVKHHDKLYAKVVRYDNIASQEHLLLPQNLMVSVRFDGDVAVEKKDFGDAPIWTSFYLASQSYRYAATKDDKALNNARRAIKGIKSLFDVTGERGLMARYFFMNENKSGDDIFFCKNIPNCLYLDDVSRDQYIGVMFGLGIAHDLLPNAEKNIIRSLISDIVYFLEKNEWKIRNADGIKRFGGIMNPNSLFAIGSASHLLAFTQIYKNVAEDFGADKYLAYQKKYAKMLRHIYLSTNLDYGYFAIALHYASFFNLIRLEDDENIKILYKKEFIKRLWKLTKGHQNALFNSIYIIVIGYDNYVVRETKHLLYDFPNAPRRNLFVRNSNRKDIETRISIMGLITFENNIEFARNPLPIAERPPTDFLWQRSSFMLDGGGNGNVQYPGVDFLLPYWMGRYYGFIGEYD